jgi:uncharacterized protein
MQGMNINTGEVISDIGHLKQSITNILTTPKGSRVMRRDYGSRLFSRIDAPIGGDIIAEIYSDIVEALFDYEPRFELKKVSVVSCDKGQLILDLEGKYLLTNESIKINNLKIS